MARTVRRLRAKGATIKQVVTYIRVLFNFTFCLLLKVPQIRQHLTGARLRSNAIIFDGLSLKLVRSELQSKRS